MNQRCAVTPGGTRQRADGEGIGVERLDRLVLRGVDVRERGAVDNDLRPHAIHRRRDRGRVAHVELLAGERDRFVRRATFVHDGGAKLPARANDGNPHAAFSIENFRIRASSNTPSHRATTAVAMQLPMTFTAVRPMSIT